MNENLNTMNISRCVRELLSVHNIGQRLFAKYVLGLSQGTVSELLSKPKPWDKLTEKGRDSYRKMHAWAADEACIYQLKSLVPRKGKDATFKQDDPAAEERIQAILSEAQRAMITPRINGCNPPQQISMRAGPIMMNGDVAAALLKERQSMMSGSSVGDKDDNSSENGDGDQRLSPNPSAAVAYANFMRLMKKDGQEEEAPGLSPEAVSRIYQEEFAKRFTQQLEESMRSSQQSSSHPFDRSQDDVRQALAIYQQEISRQMSHLTNHSSNDALARFSAAAAAGLVNGGYMGFPHGLVDPTTLALIASRDRASQGDNNSTSNGNSGNKNPSSEPMRGSQSSSAFSLVRPKVEDEERRPGDGRVSSTSRRLCASPNNNNNNPTIPSTCASEGASGAEDLSAAASPLQRMASITNSLLSQSSTPQTPSNPSRPAKAVLPPITQQQFDQYNNLNTEDIVKHVKEQLSQYSISQRLFGESVLGLSQGSVSDLLARPKPWHMLTQKGREPFIRMKMFLEDGGAVHKLVASQYKIAPEKLMRTTGFVAGPTGPPINSHAANLNALKHASRAAAGLENLNNMSGKTSLDSRQTLSPHRSDGGRSAGSTPDLASHHHHLSSSLSAAFAGLPSPALSGLFRATHPGHLKTMTDTSLSPSGQSRHNKSSSGMTSSPRGSAYPQPSVYEMAQLTADLDTQVITTKIKETLLAHNIGQKVMLEKTNDTIL
jgi:homeobox protein cut-like